MSFFGMHSNLESCTFLAISLNMVFGRSKYLLLNEEVLLSTHNICFGLEIIAFSITLIIVNEKINII